jgi:hypothetical protein
MAQSVHASAASRDESHLGVRVRIRRSESLPLTSFPQAVPNRFLRAFAHRIDPLLSNIPSQPPASSFPCLAPSPLKRHPNI